MNITIDIEFNTLLTALSDEERQCLEANIKSEGCRESLIVWDSPDGQILLDGHNRFEICKSNNIKYKVKISKTVCTRDDAKLWIIDNQCGRRNLNLYQKTTYALLVEEIISARAKQNQGKRTDLSQNSVESVDTQKSVAKKASVSHDTVYKVKTINEKANDALKEKLKRGNITINRAYQDVTLPERRKLKIESITANVPNLCDGPPVSVVLCDPPWKYEHDSTNTRAIENHYPTMTLQELFDLKDDLDKRLTKDAILFMWVTNPKVAEAQNLIEAWDFDYRTCAIWDKVRMGMGYYFRQQTESLYVAIRGNPPVPLPENRVSNLFTEKRSNTHSQKPEWAYEWIEKNYEGLEKLEMFARSTRPGWHSWGNESKSHAKKISEQYEGNNEQ